MTLLIDLGNTALKAAVVVDGAPRAVFRAVHRGIAPGVLAAQLMEAVGEPREVVMASVLAAGFTDTFVATLEARWSGAVRLVGSSAYAYGVRLAYADPARFGVDRWLALIAAQQDIPGDVVIADLGSALTVDVLRADGVHLGGVIVPGVGALREGLRGRTALELPEIALPVSAALGEDTFAGIANGALLALAGAIDGVVRIAREQHTLDPRLLLTGGDAAALRAALITPAEIVDDLVLRGLARVAQVARGASALS